jgi:hypothetical protein
MDVTLHTSRKIIVDDLSHTFEVHAPRHDFCADHHPTFTLAHPADCVLSFFLGHPSVEAVHIGNAVEYEFFCERGCSWLRGCKYEDWGVIRLGEVGQEARKF